MAMREETRRRLERTIRVQRLKQLGLALAAACAVAAFIVFIYARKADDALVEERSLPGTVKFWYQVSPRQAQGQQQGLISLTVTLDDGRDVQAGSSAHATTAKGDRITLDEKRYKSGRTTYVWK